MGRSFSKGRGKGKKTDKQRLGDSFDIGDTGEPKHTISTHNNITIQENKNIPLVAQNGIRHEEYEEEKRRGAAELANVKGEMQLLWEELAKLKKQNKEMIQEELGRMKREEQVVTEAAAGDQESRLVEEIKLENRQTHKQLTQQFDDKLENHTNIVNKFIENFKADMKDQNPQQSSSGNSFEEVETLKEMIRILSISTVIKNTAHLNFSPTEAMETIEIKISFTRGTEGTTPRMINVQNLMKITTIHELKYHLAEKYKHLKVAELAIKWKGIELADAATLLEYSICNKDRLELEVRAIVTYIINIVIEKDTILNIEVTPATRIRYVKELIYDKSSIPVDKQQLRHGENLLHDDKRMAECQIGEGETIRLEVCFVGLFPINIVCPSGVKHTFDVEAKDSVDTIKLQLSNKEHIHTSQFDLFYKNQNLENHKKLSDYGISSGETLLFRMRTPIPGPTYHQIPTY